MMVGITGQIGEPVVNGVSFGGTLVTSKPSNSHRKILQTEPGGIFAYILKIHRAFILKGTRAHWRIWREIDRCVIQAEVKIDQWRK